MADPQRLETTHQQVDLPAGLNIVSTVNLECTLNLKAIPRQANTAEYNPEIMDAVIMRIKEPKTTALIFASGKMVSADSAPRLYRSLLMPTVGATFLLSVCTGAKNEKESRVAARKFVSIMQRIGYPTNFKDFKIRNIICSYDVKFPTRLEGLACSHGSFYCLLRELGVDTSIPVAAARQLNLGSNPGSRDTRSRGIDFAVHRQRVAERQQMDTAHVKKTDPERVDMTEGMNAAYSHDSNSDDSDSTCVFRVTKGRGSIKRSKTSDDERWIVKGPMPGGPIYDTVIPSFLGHVASRMWNCEMRGILKCHNRLAVCQRLRDWYGRMSKDAWQMISWTRLSHLHSTMFSHIDTPLVSAFIERWQPDTNTFHMPFGEMTIMLHDVWHILRVPVDGRMVSADPDSSELKSDCMRLMGMSRQDLSGHWQGRGVLTDSFITLCGQNRYNETQAIAWMWMLLDSTLFVDKIENRTRASCLHEVKDGLDGVDGYSWGSATLAYLYRQLGVASRGDSQGIAGCVTLLQAWIYEYFPCFRPHQKWMILDPDSPRVCMWSVRAEDKSNCRLWSLRTRLDQMTASDVTWLPYGTDPASTVPRTIFSGWLRYRGVIEPYMPVRVLRQLGYVQAIPSRILRPVKAVRSWASKSYKVEVPEVLATDSWDIFPDSFILSISRYHIASEDPTTCDPDYMSWYYRHSHPKVLNVGAPSTGVPIPRSNTGYWFSRWAVLNWRIVEALREENEQAAAAHTIVLEQIMEDWRRAS